MNDEEMILRINFYFFFVILSVDNTFFVSTMLEIIFLYLRIDLMMRI